jgi:tripartite-type tricarboxylate transporter receptor subunit TctC
MILRAAILFAAVLAAAGEAPAQGYPNRPVRLVVPAPAGGPTDVPARLVAEGLSALAGQRFVVENRVGAGGLIAAESVFRADPDGYTILFANTSVLVVNPALQPKTPYDPAAFVPIGFVSDSPQLLIASLKLPVKSVKELIDYARANPGKLNFASGGVGTLPHLTYELFRLEAGFSAVHIPYPGGAPATTALIAGQADVLFDLVRTKVKSGEVRALALTGTARDPDLPDVPTLAESGYPAVTATSITSLVAPPGTLREIAAFLNARLNELQRQPDFIAKMKSFGAVPRASTPEELATWAKQNLATWQRVVKASGATPN